MEEPLWDCIYCGLEMFSKEEQRVHVQRACKERPAWDHWCIHCGLEFPSQAGLSMHIDRRPSTDEAPPIGKTNQFSKIAVTFEPVEQC